MGQSNRGVTNLRFVAPCHFKAQNGAFMPEISRFLGIIIAMYYKDHQPPHFHAKYGEHKATFSIKELNLLEGYLPNRVVTLVIEWAFLHRAELLSNWELLEKEAPLNKIDPLVK